MPLPEEISRRHLGNFAHKLRQHRFDFCQSRNFGVGLDDFAVTIECISSLTEFEQKLILLIAVCYIRNKLGCLANSNLQQPGCKQIKRSSMAVFIGIKQSSGLAHHLGRTHTGGFINNQPTADFITFFMLHFCSSYRS